MEKSWEVEGKVCGEEWPNTIWWNKAEFREKANKVWRWRLPSGVIGRSKVNARFGKWVWKKII